MFGDAGGTTFDFPKPCGERQIARGPVPHHEIQEPPVIPRRRLLALVARQPHIPPPRFEQRLRLRVVFDPPGQDGGGTGSDVAFPHRGGPNVEEPRWTVREPVIAPRSDRRGLHRLRRARRTLLDEGWLGFSRYTICAEVRGNTRGWPCSNSENFFIFWFRGKSGCGFAGGGAAQGRFM